VVGAVAAQHHPAQGRPDPVEVAPAAVLGGEAIGDEAVLDEQAAADHRGAAPRCSPVSTLFCTVTRRSSTRPTSTPKAPLPSTSRAASLQRSTTSSRRTRSPPGAEGPAPPTPSPPVPLIRSRPETARAPTRIETRSTGAPSLAAPVNRGRCAPPATSMVLPSIRRSSGASASTRASAPPRRPPSVVGVDALRPAPRTPGRSPAAQALPGPSTPYPKGPRPPRVHGPGSSPR